VENQLDLFALKQKKTNLSLKRPLAVFDIESTGVDFVKDRIVELSVLIINPDGEKNVYTYRFNPTIPIPMEASMVHGIYDEDVITEPTFKERAKQIFDLMDPCDLAGFNSNRFDVPLLLEEFIRAGVSFSIDNRALIDVHRIYTHFEKRSLEAAYQFYCNKTLINAHSAEADTLATYEVLEAQLEKYNADLKTDVHFLHNFSNEERFLDSGRRFIYMDGRAVFNFGKYKGRSVDEVLRTDPGYYNWMLNGDFAEHTKQKLRELKENLGKR
jgi:DNA polymerase III subunit epsilon